MQRPTAVGPDPVAVAAEEAKRQLGFSVGTSATQESARRIGEVVQNTEWVNFLLKMGKSIIWLATGLLIFGATGDAYQSQMQLNWYQPGRHWSATSCDVLSSCSWTTATAAGSVVTTNGSAMLLVPYLLFACIYFIAAMSHFMRFDSLRKVMVGRELSKGATELIKFLSMEGNNHAWVVAVMHMLALIMSGLWLFNVLSINTQYSALLFVPSIFGMYMGMYQVSRLKREEMHVRGTLDMALQRRADALARAYMIRTKKNPGVDTQVVLGSLASSEHAGGDVEALWHADVDVAATMSKTFLEAGLTTPIDLAYNGFGKIASLAYRYYRNHENAAYGEMKRAERDIVMMLTCFFMCGMVSAPIWIAYGQAVNMQPTVGIIAGFYQAWLILVSLSFHLFAAFVIEGDERSLGKGYWLSRLRLSTVRTGDDKDKDGTEKIPFTSFTVVRNLYTLWYFFEGAFFYFFYTVFVGLVRVHYLAPTSTGYYVNAL